MRRAGAGLAALCVVLTGCQQSDPSPVASGPRFSWIDKSAPVQLLGEYDERALRRALRTDTSYALPWRTRDITLTVVFPTPVQATAAAESERGTATRYPRGRGLVTIGSLLVIRGIAERQVADAAAARLVAAGGEVFVADAHTEEKVRFDLSCRPTDSDRAAQFATDLKQHVANAQFEIRPPWADPPLTAKERTARDTVVRIAEAADAASRTDPEFQLLMRDFRAEVAKRDRANNDRLDRIMQDWVDKVRELRPRRVGEPYDERVADLYLREPAMGPLEVPNPKVYRAWIEPIGTRMGALGRRTRSAGQDGYALDARASERLDIAGFAGIRWPAPLFGLLLKVDDVGCDDVRFAVYVDDL